MKYVMACSKDSVLQFLDSLLLIAVFLFQSVILNYLVINQFLQSSFTFLWFLGDFLCVLLFAFTLYLAYRARWKERQGSIHLSISLNYSRNSSRNGHRSVSSDNNWPMALNCFSRVSKCPFIYISWIFYSFSIIAKIIILFKASTHPRELNAEDFFGPQMLKVAVCMSAIVFSLLVEAHYDGHGDPVRNSYVKTVSYGMALEILDSVSFLSLLIVRETHLLYTFQFENFILGLSSVNFLLPSLALYKLSVSGFGETYPLPLEIVYKVCHLFMVNIPYLSVRVYLWQYYSYSDTSIFLVKNIYSIVALTRAIIPDFKSTLTHYKNSNTLHRSQNGKGSGCPEKNAAEEASLELSSFHSRTVSSHGREGEKLNQQATSAHCSNLMST